MKHQSRGSTPLHLGEHVLQRAAIRRGAVAVVVVLIGGGRGPVIVRRGTRVVLPETNPAGEEIAPAAVAAVLFFVRSRRGFLTAPAPERSTAETPPSSTLSRGRLRVAFPVGFRPRALLLLLRARSEPSPEHRRLFLLRVFRRVNLASTRARFLLRRERFPEGQRARRGSIQSRERRRRHRLGHEPRGCGVVRLHLQDDRVRLLRGHLAHEIVQCLATHGQSSRRGAAFPLDAFAL